MKNARYIFTLILVVTAMIALPCYLAAQQKHKGSPNALATDVVFLNDKTTLYGVVNDATDEDLTLVVDRKWLETNYAGFYQKHVEAEREAAAKNETAMIERIDTWMAEREDDVSLTFFLEGEKANAEKRLADADPGSLRFTFVKIKKSEIRRVVLQDARRRQIALVAWKHGLDDVEVRAAHDLIKELERNNVSFRSEKVDFTNDVPGTPQSTRDWAMRQNIVEFAMRDESLEFQGTGDAFFRKGEEPGLATLITRMMGQGGMGGIQQIGEGLGLPEFTRNRRQKENAGGKDWWKKQAKVADDEGFRSFAITRLKQSLLSPDVSVDVFFFGKDENNQWQLVQSFRGSANADRQSDEDVEAMMEDPQVRKIIDMAEGLGLGATGNIKKALRHGVATQAAMQEGMTRFVEFTDRYSQRLDAPALPSEPKK